MAEDVRKRIGAESSGNYDALKAITVHKSWPSASKPVLVSCSDNEQYVIKGSQNGRMVFNEYVCARLGNLLAAPVTWARFVEVDSALRANHPALAVFGPGLALGSLRIPSASERAGIQHQDIPQNRAGFAGLAILYSWVKANDHQLIYQETPPQLVYSNDHGHFFPNGPNWTIASLQAAVATIVRDPYFNACALVTDDFTPFWPRLAAITDDDISSIVSAAPADWNVPQPDRVALADYLVTRRGAVQNVF